MPFACTTCGKSFPKNQGLRTHMLRKNTCAPILDIVHQSDEDRNKTCRYCGRIYSRPDNLKRHLKTCKIAGSEEGMTKLLEHTLQRQISAQQKQIKEYAIRMDEQTTQMTMLTDMIRTQIISQGQLLGLAAQQRMITNPAISANIANVTTNIALTTINNTINVRPFTRSNAVTIPVSMLRTAFTENPRLVEYCSMTDEEKTDAEKAVPYVLEALIDLTRRAHADPESRNIYLNPHRADQVMVYDAETWRVLTLVEAIETIFDSISGGIRKIMRNQKEMTSLPISIQGSASWIPTLYEFEPDTYIEKARPKMSAHLTNLRPITISPEVCPQRAALGGATENSS
jgi:hypothetical protein